MLVKKHNFTKNTASRDDNFLLQEEIIQLTLGKQTIKHISSSSINQLCWKFFMTTNVITNDYLPVNTCTARSK